VHTLTLRWRERGRDEVLHVEVDQGVVEEELFRVEVRARRL